MRFLALRKVIEAQNDALRDARRELEIARNQFFRIFDRAPVGYSIINHQSSINETSDGPGDHRNGPRYR